MVDTILYAVTLFILGSVAGMNLVQQDGLTAATAFLFFVCLVIQAIRAERKPTTAKTGE